MRQGSFSEKRFERYRKRTRRELFVQEMDRVLPWEESCQIVEPFYPKGKGARRPPIGLERMLRIHFLQYWFNLSDPVMEEVLYDSAAMCRFVGIELGREPAPEETTVCKFRHLLQDHALGGELFATEGLMEPVGWMPALKARKRPRPTRLRMHSAMMLRAEFPVHRKSTL